MKCRWICSFAGIVEQIGGGGQTILWPIRTIPFRHPSSQGGHGEGGRLTNLDGKAIIDCLSGICLID